jgi:DNA-binding GntR family transcriptional regulator
MTTKLQVKSQQAYESIKRIIQEGKLEPGERLTEMKMAGMLGMNRGVVRESLLRLQAEGILRYRGNRRGRFVEYIEDKSLEEIFRRYELRELIEAGAARLAAMNMNGWQIEELRGLLRTLQSRSSIADAGARREAARKFHDYLLANCGNPLLHEVWVSQRLAPFAVRSPELNAQILHHLPDEQKHDERLNKAVEAITTHNPDLAEQEMREFVREITEAIRQTLVAERNKTG